MEQLQIYRDEIDEIDQKIMELLKRRFELIRAVGQLKAEQDLEVIQTERAKQVIARAGERASKVGVDADLMRRFYTDLIDVAHVIEFDIRKNYERS